jgi:competence protein ComEC
VARRSQRPSIRIPVLAFLALAVLLPVAAPSATASATATAVRVVFVDVGAGDAVIIKVGDAVVVSDIGEYNIPYVYEVLEDMGTTEIDALILSHPHDDHVKNAALLLESHLYTVRRALLSRNSYWEGTATNRRVMRTLEQHNVPITYVRTGQTFNFGGARWTILNPPQGRFTTSNQVGNSSVVFVLETRGKRFLFSGDIESAAEHLVAEEIEERELAPIDVLLVTHHGSKNASHTFFLDAAQPKSGVISVGRGHGHPDGEAIERLRDLTPRPGLWCTAWNGNVRVTVSTAENLRIRGTEPFAAWWVKNELRSRGPCVEYVGDESG